MTNFDYNTTPFNIGTFLWIEFLEPINLTPDQLAEAINIPHDDINSVLRGEHGVTPVVASQLDNYFGMPDGYFMHVQQSIDNHSETT